MKVLVMGQNPARSSITGKPFIGTDSGKKLLSILKRASIDFKLTNLSNEYTEGNKPLKRSEVVKIAKSPEFLDKIGRYEKVLAIGRQAELALKLAKVHHELPNLKVLWVPHPSGLNRFWNDHEEKEVVEMIRVFVNEGIVV